MSAKCAGLTSLSQSELQMVMQLTDEIKQEPEALNQALNALNLGMPSPAASAPHPLGACRCACLRHLIAQGEDG